MRSKIRKLYLLAIILRLFQKNLDTKNVTKDKVLEDDSNEYSRIRCPLCKWQPKKSSRWHCMSGGFPEFYSNGCGTIWNTFDTRGKCPGCNHQWRWTTCLSCHQDSPHEDWYK